MHSEFVMIDTGYLSGKQIMGIYFELLILNWAHSQHSSYIWIELFFGKERRRVIERFWETNQ
jgi:hypothetical protein